MPGFRAAAWTSCGSLGVGLVIAVIGIRGIGIVGQKTGERPVTNDGVEIAELGHVGQTDSAADNVTKD